MSQPLIHGNARSPLAMPRSQLLPSLAREIEADPDEPAKIYNKHRMKASTAEEHRFKVPVSKRQIKDLQRNYRRHTGQNDIETILMRLSKEYRSIHLLVVAPRLVLVQAEPLMLQYVRELFQKVSWKAGSSIS